MVVQPAGSLGHSDPIVTLTGAFAVLPSQVTVTVAVSTTIPRTSPDASTVAMSGRLLVHEKTRPDSTLPLLSRAVAVSGVEPPTETPTGAGGIVTDATGTDDTTMPALPLAAPLVAVIVAEPRATAVT